MQILETLMKEDQEGATGKQRITIKFQDVEVKQITNERRIAKVIKGLTNIEQVIFVDCDNKSALETDIAS